MRRFTIKAEFRTLDPQRIPGVYNAVLGSLARGTLSGAAAIRLSQLRGLTTADLVLIRRNRALLDSGRVSHDELIDEIEAEIGIRLRRQPARVGFRPEPDLRDRKEIVCV